MKLGVCGERWVVAEMLCGILTVSETGITRQTFQRTTFGGSQKLP